MVSDLGFCYSLNMEDFTVAIGLLQSELDRKMNTLFRVQEEIELLDRQKAKAVDSLRPINDEIEQIIDAIMRLGGGQPTPRSS